MMVVRDVRKNEFKTDLNDDGSNDNADVGFDIEMPDEINND